MGVHGLWKLIEPSGRVVALETLEGKVLAVDMSIWLHQAIKGYQGADGAPVPNAHLLTLYRRLCKLLYFRIKPVFVFDGGVPVLKHETIRKRNQLKSRNLNEADKIQKQLINTLLKHSAVNKVLSERTKASLGAPVHKPRKESAPKDDDMFVLPPSQVLYESSSEEEEEITSTSATDSDRSPHKYFNIHDIDEKSVQFRALPADVRHEILTDLKETRKQSSWGRIHELPKQSDDFSTYQMQRLLKRYSIQSCLEEAEKEMGGATLSLNELESLLNDHGVITDSRGGARIASDENTRYLFIKDVKKVMEQTKRREVEEAQKDSELEAAIMLSLESEEKPSSSVVSNADAEEANDLETAIRLSLQEVPSTSKETPSSSSSASFPPVARQLSSSTSDSTPTSSQEFAAVSSSQETQLNPNISAYLNTLKDSDFDSSDGEGEKQIDDEVLRRKAKASEKVFSAARNYMMEYGGLTQAGVAEIFGEQVQEKPLPSSTDAKIQDSEVGVISDSSDDDFIEVSTNQAATPAKAIIEIEFNTKEELVDDMFSDIFKAEVNNIPSEAVPEDIVEETPSIIPDPKPTPIPPTPPQISTDTLLQMQTELSAESDILLQERGARERLGTSITEQMTHDAKALLRVFGIPYIVAPMEAESQCAFLNEIALTDGTITDDSDIWLFGAHTVYKNFFNHDRQVLEFRADTIRHHFQLDRGQMIALALLVGSDYTCGIPGVGPVTALEVLAAFSSKSRADADDEDAVIARGLANFRRWLTGGKRVHGRGSKAMLRNKLKNVQLHEGFPSARVIEAYLRPAVDVSEEAFTWGTPKLQTLIDYAREKFGWTIAKTTELVEPVLRKWTDNRAQKRIHDYFAVDSTKPKLNTSVEIQNKLSKRVKKALGTLANGQSSSSEEEDFGKATNPEETAALEILQRTKKLSKKRTEGMKKEVEKKLKLLEKKELAVEEENKRKAPNLASLHRRETIPQKEKTKNELLQKRLKAIEVFRKSAKGPGFVPKRGKIRRVPKEDAGLSESESSGDE